MLELPVAGKVGIPFMIAGVTAARLNSTRMMEAVVIAMVSSGLMAAGGYFIALPVLQEQVGTIRRDIAETKDTIKDIKRYQDVRREYRDIQAERLEAKIAAIQVEMAKARK